MKYRLIQCLAPLAVVLILGGCSLNPEPLKNNKQLKTTQARLNQFFQAQPKVTHSITLADVIAQELKFNLAHQLRQMQTALSNQRFKLAVMEMPPSVDAAYNHNYRKNSYASLDTTKVIHQGPTDATQGPMEGAPTNTLEPGMDIQEDDEDLNADDTLENQTNTTLEEGIETNAPEETETGNTEDATEQTEQSAPDETGNPESETEQTEQSAPDETGNPEQTTEEGARTEETQQRLLDDSSDEN